MSAGTLVGGLAQALKSKLIPLDLGPGGAIGCQVVFTAFRPLQAIEWLCLLPHEQLAEIRKQKEKFILHQFSYNKSTNEV